MSVFVSQNLKIDESGLNLRKNEPSRKLWLNGFNDVVELRAFATKPDIPNLLSDLAGLKDYYAKAAKTQNAEVLDLEVRVVAGIKAICLTMVAPAKPTGSTFVSSLALPFRDGSFVLKIQALETITQNDLGAATDLSYGLTRVRAEIKRLEQSLVLEPIVLRQARFEKKPFWRF